MKKFFIYILLPVLLFMLTGTAFTSCSGGDDESTPTLYPTGENPIQQQYFSIEGASFIAGEMPKSTIQETIQGIVLGNNNITISSGEPYATFYLGIEGVSGYYEIQANDVATTRAAIYTYAIILNVNGTIENFAITLKGKTQSGEITEACSIAVDKMEPSVDNSTLTIEEQKEYLEKVGIDFINELKSLVSHKNLGLVKH